MNDLMTRPKILVAICTYKRNKSLARLLEALIACATRVSSRAAVGVVVVDNSRDGQARTIVEKFANRFELGTAYRISGHQNISLARNLAIETACDMGNWTAMIDDDCEPVTEWLEALLDTQKLTTADAVTGTMVRRVPAGSPKWITEEPFLEYGLQRYVDGTQLTRAATFNSMISSHWLKDHPTIRFRADLGLVGGEDMVFYGSAHAAGLRIHYSERAFVYENEPASRATFWYWLRAFFWHGNSSYVTGVQSGTPPARLFIHGINLLRKALVRPITRICRGERPQMRYCLASVLHAIGVMIGSFGIWLKHPS